ncbi:hypothetical protein [Nocardioides yefusunii]|uniref:DUF4190 domain-containing protein n=1 Tax=Nocardioides yefusunii TaxID=2500546 RepID=A0ABW1QXS9_9ACTN|nr:hypothetical protein [Nocardioides yefusunii]
MQTWSHPGGTSYSPAYPQASAALLPRPVPAVGEHQAARPALVVGIAALVGSVIVGLGLLFAPFAWAMGSTAVREIDASHGALTGRRAANAGRILGIVGTAFMGIALLAVLGLAALGTLATAGQS